MRPRPSISRLALHPPAAMLGVLLASLLIAGCSSKTLKDAPADGAGSQPVEVAITTPDGIATEAPANESAQTPAPPEGPPPEPAKPAAEAATDTAQDQPAPATDAATPVATAAADEDEDVTPAPSPADHPAAPPPDIADKIQPPGGLPPEADTPKAPEHVFEADLRGDTDGARTIRKPDASNADKQKRIAPSHLCDQRPPDGEEVIDYTRRRVEEMVCTASMWFDGMFGDRYYVHEARHVYGTVELSQSYSEFYGSSTRLRFDARIDLPNINKRLSGFIGRNNDDDFITDRFDNSTLRARFPQLDDRDEWLAGFGYALPNRKSLQTDFRLGVRGVAHPEMFAQSRLRYNAYSDESNLVHLRLTPFWTTRRGFGVTAGAEYSHVLSDVTLLRWRNIGTVAEDINGVGWRSSTTLYQSLRRHKLGLAYELFVRGESDDDVALHEYGAQTTLRHPMLRSRLFGEWVAGYTFPRENKEDQREGSFLVGVAVEMPFGLKEEK